ncbi:hypothetical protein ACHHYP_07935 [Achlya hypogyna]|uniref:Uncharacterized protein n=1 Tax=Achlya hypogyna TaxID=1202772 RepID=A0A1V9YQ86_ACHHY|nr:hypothetical protein ACHHYP_07935 [Achlya hypogyna]
MAASDKVSETDYLVLERELYEESIRVIEKRLEKLADGSLPEFVEQCRVFEAEKQARLDLALLHRQLLEKNSDELLAFDLQQLEDVYAEALERALHPPTATTLLDDDCTMELPPPTGPLHTEADLAAAFQRMENDKRMYFNVKHITTGQPTAQTIVAHLRDIRDAWIAADKKVHEADDIECLWDAKKATLYVDDKPLHAGDAIILTSELAQEEYFGEIASLNDDEVSVKLLCGSVASVTVAALRSRRCRLTRQSQALATGAPFSPLPATPVRHSSTPRSRRTHSRHRRVLSLL